MFFSEIQAKFNDNYQDKILEDYYGMNKDNYININGLCVGNIMILSALGFDYIKDLKFGFNNKNNFNEKVIFRYKDKPLKLLGTITIEEIYYFILKVKKKFDFIDNFFDINNTKTIIQLSSFIILGFDNHNIISKINEEKINKNIIKVSDKIYSLNSNLSYINKSIFSRSISYGYISSQLTDNIYFLDIRGIPNAISSIIFHYHSHSPILICFLSMNTKKLFTPILFGYSIQAILSILCNNKCLESSKINDNCVYDSIFMISDQET